MIRQVNVKPQDIVTIRSYKLLAQLDIEDLDLILKERRLPYMDTWNAPVVQSRHTDWWIAWACEAQDDMEAADRQVSQRVEALYHERTPI